MAKERTSVRMQAQVKLMSEQGYSIRAIARTLKIARKTVRKILGITVAESSEPAPWIGTVDWEYVRREIYGKGTTVKQIQRGAAADLKHADIQSSLLKQPRLNPDPHRAADSLCSA